MTALLLTLFFLLVPALIVFGCYKYPVLDNIGAVILCYLTGLFVGNMGLLPAGASVVQENLSEISVALALPLLLFSMDVKHWFHIAGKAILSMGLAILAVLITASIGCILVSSHLETPWKYAGMATAVYTGGTPNMAALKTALQVEANQFLVMHAYDTAVCLVYIIFFTSVAQRLFNKFLKPFEKSTETSERNHDLEVENVHSYRGIFQPKSLLTLTIAFSISVAIVGVSLLIGKLFPGNFATSATILSITTLGMLASFVPAIRNMKKTFQFGMYITYIFCLVVSSMAHYSLLLHVNWSVLVLVVICVFGSTAIHAVLCKLFNIDTDTFIITSTSAIFSPPFVPVVASALKNREIILSGLTTGIIGYVVGNYLGIGLSYALQSLLQ